MKRFRRLLLLTLLLGMVMAPMSVANPAQAHRRHSAATVTHGSFTTLPGGEGLGYDITGHAVMVRVPRTDSTKVIVIAKGLDPHRPYKVHVHNASCDAVPAGGGHYQHQVGGDVDAINEIWPVFTTDGGGVGVGWAVHRHVARADAQAVVIHWPEDSSVRLACLDLG